MTDRETNTNKVCNSDRTGYVEFAKLGKAPSGRTLIDNFITVLELGNNRKITLNYDKTEFAKENFDGKLVKIEPENTKLSEDEKIEVLKKLGNLIAEAFIPFYDSGDFKEGTELFKKVADEFLGEKEAKDILVDNYIESIIETTLSYAKKNNLCIRSIFSNYKDIIDIIRDSIINKFSDDPEGFIINLLDKDFEGSSIITYLTLDCLRIELKENFFNSFFGKEFLEKLSSKQYGKLSVIISQMALMVGGKNISSMLKQTVFRINNNYKAEINDFSESFCKTMNDILSRKDKKANINMAQYTTYMIKFLTYLNDDICKNIIVADMCNIMPNFITYENGLSKLTFIDSLNEQFSLLGSNFKINETTRYASILDSLASYTEKEIKKIKNFKEIKKDLKDTQKCGVILADLVFSGKIEGDTIQKYFESFKKCGFSVPDIVEAVINNIGERKDIYNFIKKPFVKILFEELKKFSGPNVDNENFFTKLAPNFKTRTERIDEIITKISQNPDKISSGKEFTEIELDSGRYLLNSFFGEKNKLVQKLKTGEVSDEQSEQEFRKVGIEEETKLKNSENLIERLRLSNSELVVKNCVKFHYDLEKIDEANKLNQKGMMGSKIIDLTDDKTRKGYYEYLYRKNPDKFSIIISLDNNKEISFNYDHSKFNNFGECTDLDSLIGIEPEGTKLSDEEKKTAIEKLGNTICENFVPFHIDDPNLNSAANRTTRLFKASASKILQEKKLINSSIIGLSKKIEDSTLNYAKESNIELTSTRQVVNNCYFPEIKNAIIDEFEKNPEELIKFFLGNNDVIYLEKVFDAISNSNKYKELLENDDFLGSLSIECFSKLSSVICRQYANKDLIKIAKVQFAKVLENYNKEGKIEEFAINFNKNYFSLFDRPNQINQINIAAMPIGFTACFSELDEKSKKTIINNLVELVPNFIYQNNKTSKTSLIEGLKGQELDRLAEREEEMEKKRVDNLIDKEELKRQKRLIEDEKIEYEYMYDSIMKKTIMKENDSIVSKCALCKKSDPFLVEVKKNIIKTPEDAANILADSVCSGRIEKDIIQTYLKGIENLGFKASYTFELTIKSLSNQEDIDPSKKEELVYKLCNESENYKNQEIKNTRNIFKKIRLKREIKNIEKIKNNISNIISNMTDVNTKKSVLLNTGKLSNEQQFKQEFRKASNNEKNRLGDDETTAQRLQQQTSPELFAEDNGSSRNIGGIV